MYSPELTAEVGEIVKDMAYFFGYAKVDEDKENPTGFFDYKTHNPEDLKRYKGFKAQNKNMIDWVCSMNEKEASEIQYKLSDKSKEVPIMGFETTEFATRPIKDFSEKKLYGQSFTKID